MTTNSIRVTGEQTPAWLGASLLVVGLASWVGAGAVAQARPSGDVVAIPRQPAAATETPAPEVPPPDTADATDDHVVILDRPEAPARAQARPQAQAQAHVCAPVVELRFAQGATGVSDAAALRRIVKAANAFETRKIVVEGYASAAGPSHRNLQLSHRRARRAKAKLVREGLDAKRITIQAFGEYRPNLGGDEERDRRVVVKIQGMPPCPDSDPKQDPQEVAQ